MKVRYLIKFSKEGEIKFISHLDLLRTVHRMIRRTDLPVEYSKGFSPHMNVTIAQPLSVGMYSSGEYMDMACLEDVEVEEIKNRLNAAAPRGIKIYDVVKVMEENTPPSMALIEAAEYRIAIKYTEVGQLKTELEKLSELKQWNIVKTTKSGEKEVDIRPLIKQITFDITAGTLMVETMVSSGSRENLSAALLAEFISKHTSGVNTDDFIDIERKDMFALKNGQLLPLNEYVRI